MLDSYHIFRHKGGREQKICLLGPLVELPPILYHACCPLLPKNKSRVQLSKRRTFIYMYIYFSVS